MAQKNVVRIDIRPFNVGTLGEDHTTSVGLYYLTYSLNEHSMAVTIFAFLFVLVFTGIFKYLPHHLVIMRGRAVYYLWGQEGDERLLWQWRRAAGEGGLLKEL